MDWSHFWVKRPGNDKMRYLFHYQDILSPKENFWVSQIVVITRGTHRKGRSCHTSDVPLHQPRRRDEKSSSCLGWCNGLSLVGRGQSFRWMKRVIETICDTQIFSFYEKTSLQRNVGSQPSNCHFWVKRPGMIKWGTYFITKTLFCKNKEIQYAKLLLLLVLPIGMLLRVLPTMCHCINHCVGTKILEAALVVAMAYRW